MADYTSTQAGDWNASATWGGGGTPSVNDDTATIEHAVAYNLGDSSIDFGNVTINAYGTLIFPTDANSTINFNATAILNITDKGTLIAGRKGSPVQSAYHCRIYWDQGASERYVLEFRDGANIEIYGDPAYYGNRRTADLDSTWSTGQTLYVTGDITADWVSGHFFYIHKNGSYSNWTTDADVFEIDTIGSYDSDNDRTPITIVETAPAVTYTAVHATTGYQNKLIMVSRNVEFGDPAVGWEQDSSNFLYHIDDTMIFGWHRVNGNGNNNDYNKCVFLSNSTLTDGSSQGGEFIDCECIGNVDTFSGGLDDVYIKNCNIVSADSGFYLRNCKVEDCDIVSIDYTMVTGGVSNLFINCNFVACDDVLRVERTSTLINCNFYTNNIISRDPLSVRLCNCDFTDNGLLFDDQNENSWSLILEDCTFEGIDRLPLRLYSTYGDSLPLQYGDTDWQRPLSENDWILQATPTSASRNRYERSIALSPLNRMFDFAKAGSRFLSFRVYPINWPVLNEDMITLELSYLDSESNITTTTVTNTGTYANDGWRDIKVYFTPLQDGIVSFNLYLKSSGTPVRDIPGIWTGSNEPAAFYVTNTGTRTTGQSETSNWADANCYGDITTAISQTSNGDTVVIAEGTYSSTDNVPFDTAGKSITIRSLNGPETCILDCTNTVRASYFEDSETNATIIDGLQIINGTGDFGGGLRCSASPTIKNCIIRDCYAVDAGGGINSYEVSPVIDNCEIFNCVTDGSGGGIRSVNGIGSITVKNCRIHHNEALDSGADGGGIVMFEGGTLEDCLIHDNYSLHCGGGLSCQDGVISIKRCYIYNNICITNGAGIHTSNATLTVEYSAIYNNHATTGNTDSNAGGVSTYTQTDLTLYNCSIVNNSTGRAANINLSAADTSDIVATNCIIVAADSGDAIYTEGDGSTCTVTYSCIHPDDHTGTGNTSDDPLLTNERGGFLRLTNDSPCLDTGITIADVTNGADIDGNIVGDSPDMGCYEGVVSLLIDPVWSLG